jgi:hypothetical protein
MHPKAIARFALPAAADAWRLVAGREVLLQRMLVGYRHLELLLSGRMAGHGEADPAERRHAGIDVKRVEDTRIAPLRAPARSGSG